MRIKWDQKQNQKHLTVSATQETLSELAVTYLSIPLLYAAVKMLPVVSYTYIKPGKECGLVL